MTGIRCCVSRIGFIKQHRSKQQEEWLWRLVHEELRRSFDTCPAIMRELPGVLQGLAKEELLPWDGARQLLDIYFGHFVCASTPSTVTTTVREELPFQPVKPKEHDHDDRE